jgi:DUF4097 and DUF4098 domain-containing protein YvlB
MKRQLVFMVLGLAVALAGCGDWGPEGINGNATVAPGEKTGDVSRVNGSLDIQDGATIQEASTVNGSITLGKQVTATSATTVNGSITLKDGTKVSGDVTTVNGGLQLASGSEVGGALTNVNGSIRLEGARVAGNIETVNADIDIGPQSRVEGGINVKKASGIGFGNNIPKIVIGPGATVQGAMKFEREVKLYVSDSATIGAVEGATAEKFSGPTPPQ